MQAMVMIMLFPAQFSAAIFDMDGTILDSMGMWDDIDREFLERRGIPFDPEYSKAMKSKNFSEGAEYTIQKYGLKNKPEELFAEWDAMALDYYRNTLQLKEGAADYLKALKEQGISLGLATMSSEEYYTLALTRTGVIDLFDFLTHGGAVKRGKDFPDLYLLAAEKLEKDPSQCLIFEDAMKSILGAKKGGFAVCAVFDPSSQEHWEEMKQIADYYLEDFRQGIRKRSVSE